MNLGYVPRTIAATNKAASKTHEGTPDRMEKKNIKPYSFIFYHTDYYDMRDF